MQLLDEVYPMRGIESFDHTLMHAMMESERTMLLPRRALGCVLDTFRACDGLLYGLDGGLLREQLNIA